MSTLVGTVQVETAPSRLARKLYEAWACRQAIDTQQWDDLSACQTMAWCEVAGIAITLVNSKYFGAELREGPPLATTPTDDEMAANAPDPVAAIREIRTAVYGDFYDGHRDLGCILRGLIQGWLGQEVPEMPVAVVFALMIATKLNRITANQAQGRFKADTYLDGQAYFKMAGESIPRERDAER